MHAKWSTLPRMWLLKWFWQSRYIKFIHRKNTLQELRQTLEDLTEETTNYILKQQNCLSLGSIYFKLVRKHLLHLAVCLLLTLTTWMNFRGHDSHLMLFELKPTNRNGLHGQKAICSEGSILFYHDLLQSWQIKP